MNVTAYRVPDPDWAKAHPLLQHRLPGFLAAAADSGRGVFFLAIEFYRPEIRQQWLYGQGRTAEECQAKGVPAEFARPGAIVTNAWSAAVSAHGWTFEDATPAAAAVDLDPVGTDGKPWTPDDPWDVFIGTLEPVLAAHGLRHFHAPGKQIWDKPHVQLVEWDDAAHRLVLP